jgi:hypothetical protein
LSTRHKVYPTGRAPISVNTPVVVRDDFGAGSARELREQFARTVLGSAAATDVEIVIIAVFMTAR